MEMEIYRDTAQANLDSVQVLLDRNTPLPDLNFPIDFFLTPGFNSEINLQVNYADLLSGVNIRDDSAEQIYQKIVNNITSFYR